MGTITKRTQVEFVSKAEDKRLVTGIVYEPDTIDLQDDYATADEIQEAAHDYMAEAQVVKAMHEGKPLSIDVVESYIAPLHFNLDDGQLVKKGSWVVVLKVNDEEVWKKVKTGEFTGLSMGGHAEREAV